MKLEDIKTGMRIRGLEYGRTVKLTRVDEYQDRDGNGLAALLVGYRFDDGRSHELMLYPKNAATLEIAGAAHPLDFGAAGEYLRLAAEAWRIRVAHLFNSQFAVHSSRIDPLPHQLIAVYDIMLQRQPLRFLLADDPGAGKTIMTGLLIRELIAREEVKRCLICVPGGLAEQWRDEMGEKFDLEFEILGSDPDSGNRAFERQDLLIARLDQLKRDEFRESLTRHSWDLVVCDEAHKMSASWAGKSVTRTKRYQLGEALGRVARNLLLLTATPHNGIAVDFQLFLCLLDPDRFHLHSKTQTLPVDPGDLMRRLQKESLRTMDGKALFPERRAKTLDYRLSLQERKLYEAVTKYVREEFDRANQLAGNRRTSVGFALTILQRRLASSPLAIWQSLKRRRARLQERLDEARQNAGAFARILPFEELGQLDDDDLDVVEEGQPASELESLSDQVSERSSAASNLDELEKEIKTLTSLEHQAQALHTSGVDQKWQGLAELLRDEELLRQEDGSLRKLIIFTEHRDTLSYLRRRLQDLPGRIGIIDEIHGGTPHPRRRKIQRRFQEDPEFTILVATDAAGEGINLHSAHLMVNYDLPWNPNRLEQRFGRIHRIGQKEVCYLWNLVTGDTREGEVYQRLLEKMDIANRALNDTVFDVLGAAFSGRTLRDLMIEAVREVNQQVVSERIDQRMDEEVANMKLKQRVQRQSHLTDILGIQDVSRTRDELERAEIYRLQPHYLSAFCKETLEHYGGTLLQRGNAEFHIGRVPLPIWRYVQKYKLSGVSTKYNQISYNNDQIPTNDSQSVEFLHPGHPLLRALIGKVLDDFGEALSRGAILVDERPDHELRVLLLIELVIENDCSIQGKPERMKHEAMCLELNPETLRQAGIAPWLDLRPATVAELVQARPLLQQDWVQGEDLQRRAVDHAVQQLIPDLLTNCQPAIELVQRKLAETRARLTPSIHEEDRKVADFTSRENRGTPQERNIAQVNRQRAQMSHQNLLDRLELCEEESQRRMHLRPRPLRIVGGALVVPASFFAGNEEEPDLTQRDRIEQLAMDVVMRSERQLGHTPLDVSAENLGYDIESQVEDGPSRFIEVKGRSGGGDITVTRNEHTAAGNKGKQFILAVVEVEDDQASEPVYISGDQLRANVDDIMSSVRLSLQRLKTLGEAPR